VSSSNLVTNSCFLPEIKKRLVDEIDARLDPLAENLQELFTLEEADSNEFLMRCYMESLRFEPPVPQTTSTTFTQDVELCGFNIRKGDPLMLNIEQLHHDPTQWQRHEEYLPDRWDTSNPLSKKPDGGQRHAYAFAPFVGGRRVCVGKTFAELAVKFTLPLIFYHMDFSFKEEAHKITKPKYVIGLKGCPVIILKKENRREIK
jgi:cytochrome P450